jgi:hypothetical protein
MCGSAYFFKNLLSDRRLVMMQKKDKWVVKNARELAKYLSKLHAKREQTKTEHKVLGLKRKTFTPGERKKVLDKTGKRCHICGGSIRANDKWQADHVLAHSGGGGYSVENYLPTHPLCNNYRWDYISEEFQLILKLGVWCRTQIEKETTIGKEIAERFLSYEASRIKRRKQ